MKKQEYSIAARHKTIALIDVSISAHHLAFMRLFAKCLLELQYKVIVFIPEVDKVSQWVKENCAEYYNNYYGISFNDVEPKNTLFGRFNHAVNVWMKWKNVSSAIKRAEKSLQLNVDFVFFAWLDTFLANYLYPVSVDLIFSYNWSGLYFHPKHLRVNQQSLSKKISISEIDCVLKAGRCKNIVIHDSGISARFQDRLQKNVIVFPEIADSTPPEASYEISAAITRLSRKRTVIGIIGLEIRKGTLTMVRLAKAAPATDFYFVFAGRFNNKDYPAEEAEEIQTFINSRPENCYIHLLPIEEGAKFNAVFCSFDIPFIVYNNFASTSNLVTKAAIFNKRVLATERYIIGEDVKAYNLGLTVEEGNVDQCLQAIQILRKKLIYGEPLPESYQVYKELQSVEKLSEAFKEVVRDI